MRYRVNNPQVIAETVAGETIIVNLGTGHYFNLQGTAVDIWEALARSEPVPAIIGALKARFDAADGEIEDAVAELVREFEAAQLIVAADETDDASAANGVPPPNQERQPFVAPTYTTFTDMQDIILLDPVHEVDPRGWPHAPTGT